MRRQLSQTTIRVVDPSKLAGKEKKRLLAGLARFANLGDELEDYRNFAHQSPEFWPVEIMSHEDTPIRWAPACHKLVLIYRDSLRRLWNMDPNAMRDESLPLLMGLSHHLQDVGPMDLDFLIPPTNGAGFPLKHRWGIWGLAWKEVHEAHQGARIVDDAAGLFPSWQSGEFLYRPANDFHRAVYVLFRERWRAKVCYQCGAYFIAQRPPQLYCSTKCFREAKRIRDLTWRRRERSKSRKGRTAKARRKVGK